MTKKYIRMIVKDLDTNTELVRDYPYTEHSENYTLGQQIVEILEDLDSNVDNYGAPSFEIITK